MTYTGNETVYVCNNRQLISFLWPDRIFSESSGIFFDSRRKYVIMSDFPLDVVGVDYIRISTTYGGTKIDTRDGFTKFLHDSGKASKKTVSGLEKIDNDVEFWIYAKIAWLKIPYRYKSIDDGVYQLFESVSRMKFGECYKIYRSMDTSHHVVMSSLLTFFLKAKNSESGTGTKSYKILLGRLKNRLPIIKRHLENYCDSRRAEDDFLSFLYMTCSA